MRANATMGDRKDLVDGIAGEWAFGIRLPAQCGSDVGGEVFQDLHVDVHTVQKIEMVAVW